MGALIKIVFFGIFASLLVALYGDEIVHIVSNEAPLARQNTPKQIHASNNIVNTVQIPRQRDGHYWAEVGINHSNVSFIVDTGASILTLSYNDAKKLNIPYFENDYNVVVNTAAGQTRMAPVRLDSVRIGSIEIYDVDALIARDGELAVSLLGMNYLNRLDRFEFRDQRLILEQ